MIDAVDELSRLSQVLIGECHLPTDVLLDLAYPAALPRLHALHDRLGSGRSDGSVLELPLDAVKKAAQPVIACHGLGAILCVVLVVVSTLF